MTEPIHGEQFSVMHLYREDRAVIWTRHGVTLGTTPSASPAATAALLTQLDADPCALVSLFQRRDWGLYQPGVWR